MAIGGIVSCMWVYMLKMELRYSGLIFTTAQLLRRSLSYSRLYPQFKYMTFIYSQSFKNNLVQWKVLFDTVGINSADFTDKNLF